MLCTFHCEGDQALAQVAQRDCEVTIPGDIKKPSGHRSHPEQLAHHRFFPPMLEPGEDQPPPVPAQGKQGPARGPGRCP